MGQYEKLGDLLRESIENSKGKPWKNSGKKQEEPVKTEESRTAEISVEKKKKNEPQGKPSCWKKSDAEFLAVLNLDDSASEKDVKDAYRKLLKKYHPDNIPKYPEMQKTAAEKTRKIVAAYRKLSESNKN